MRCTIIACCRWTVSAAPVKVGPVALDVKDVPWAVEADVGARRRVQERHLLSCISRCATRARTSTASARSASASRPRRARWARSRPSPKPIKRQLLDGSRRCSPTPTARAYMYFGGIWGGQLQRWTDRQVRSQRFATPISSRTTSPRCRARSRGMTPDMKSFAETPRDVRDPRRGRQAGARRRP